MNRFHEPDELILLKAVDSKIPPRMSLKINEFPLNQSYVWVPQYELMVITCFAWEARPKMNLSWVINNLDRIYTKTNVTEGDTQIYNSKSLLHYRPTQENEKISCYGNSVTSSEYHVGVSLYTYVFPQLYITLNGERTDKKYVSAGENLAVICHADGARPTAVLSFIDRNEVVTEMTPTTNTSRRISFVLIKPLKEENITCTSTQRRDSERDLKTVVTVTVHLFGFGYLQWIILSIAILLTCFLFVCIYKITIKIRASMSVNLSTDADTTLGGSTQLQLNTLPAEQSLLQNPLQGSLKNKQKSDLPSIPIDESNSIHSSGSESNYYSAAEDRGTKDRIFTESEFCILLAIKVGTIYNRWMGTIRMSSDVNKCAVLTTITEGITKKKIIHWNSFVKRTLDLPTTDRLTRIEGIAVDKTNIYLVTEHSVCETLESRLTFDPSSHSSPFLVLDVMKHITAIVEGIECLQSFGFLHPGLSTKKILYTKEGICKLYDFCLAEDASKIVTIKKPQFPPESFFRNEYSAESDVWSTAVVIWEILSMGDSPFPVDEDIKPGQDVKAPTLNWPQRYFQLRYPLSTKLTKYHGNR
ncbi:putative vascular endothelial growth factor receptor 1 [Apostichopus japonicus]|uniref:Putative vascular endothelial growth factor receptor 1 n=1 Tax=Stichopus japonicus TaxID=307972 RepID=A0A2G8K7H2_STIJA|nr:putative vascular endothelial growth factor receptor 1 [Apostichopus japonicus]